jgi:hypothetical protein
MMNALKVAYELARAYTAASVDYVPPETPGHRIGPIAGHARTREIPRTARAAALVPVHGAHREYPVAWYLWNGAMQMKHIELQPPREWKQGLHIGNELKCTFWQIDRAFRLRADVVYGVPVLPLGSPKPTDVRCNPSLRTNPWGIMADFHVFPCDPYAGEQG